MSFFLLCARSFSPCLTDDEVTRIGREKQRLEVALANSVKLSAVNETTLQVTVDSTTVNTTADDTEVLAMKHQLSQLAAALESKQSGMLAW